MPESINSKRYKSMLIARHPTVKMQSNVKFLHRLPGGMLEYETGKYVDAVVSHTSYTSLKSALQRPGKHVIFIHSGTTRVEDDGSYSAIAYEPEKRLAVLYRDANLSPIHYNGFQG